MFKSLFECIRWDAMLNITNFELEIVSVVDMYLF